MINKTNNKMPARLVQLITRWEKQVEIVKDDIESYYDENYNISKIQISKDASDMKNTFKQIEAILKEI